MAFSDDNRWEKDLPTEGPVHNACVRLLFDRGIKQAASEDVTEDQRDITVNKAAETITGHLRNFIRKSPFVNYSPRLHASATTASSGETIYHNRAPANLSDGDSTEVVGNTTEAQSPSLSRVGIEGPPSNYWPQPESDSIDSSETTICATPAHDIPVRLGATDACATESNKRPYPVDNVNEYRDRRRRRVSEEGKALQ